VPTTTAAATSKSTSTRATATPTHELALALARTCPVGAIAVLRPQRAASVVGAVADARARSAQINNLAYPADGAIATVSSITLREQACAAGRPTIAKAQLREVSLFGGTVAAASVILALGGADSASVRGLTVEGRTISPSNATRVPLQSWGYIVAGPQTPLQLSDGNQAIAALAVHLLQTHAGLPAGTTILVAFASLHKHTTAGTTNARQRTRAASHRAKSAPAAGTGR
jgi:hypothetical protein